MPVTAQVWSPFEVTPPNPADCAPSAPLEIQGGGPPSGPSSRRILILDDDQEFLDTYSRILGRLPSRPEVRVATCATRALALLDAEPFALLITDLRMPKIDGFQVLLGARQRFPALRTVAITGLGDQQYRARAYASGIDLYTEKPTTPSEIRLFGECVDALLTQAGPDGGFRGIHSKSLMDLIQIECLSQNSGVLRITRGSLEGRVWIEGGNVIDAEVQDVWEAITTNEGRERWIEPDPNRVLIVDAEVAPDSISWWWWSAEDPATHVVLRVVAIPTGTRVVVTETGSSSFPIAELSASFHRVLAFA